MKEKRDQKTRKCGKDEKDRVEKNMEKKREVKKTRKEVEKKKEAGKEGESRKG